MDEVVVYLLFFAGFVITAQLLNIYLLERSRKFNIRKANMNAVRWGSQTKPITGGITFFVLFLLAAIIFSLFYAEPLFNNEFIFIGLTLILAFFMGLADDMMSTSPYLKFVVQMICGLLLIKGGISVQMFEHELLNQAITLLWIVGIMNSVNMLDNMDAITGSVSVVIIAGFILINVISGFPAAELLILIAAASGLISFLYFNWHPSKMYMGDNGSQFLGALLGIFAIKYIWNNPDVPDVTAMSEKFLLIFLAFLIPITDTTTVTINRLLQGKSPFMGGRDHTTHHLCYRGFSERKVALTYAAISIVSVAITVLIIHGFCPPWIVWVSGIISIFVFSFLYVNTHLKKPEKI